jgi:hypothetical protein
MDWHSGARVPQVGLKFDEWAEHEGALREAWVRDRESRGIDDAVIVEEEIDIDGARRIAKGWPTSQFVLDLLGHGEDLFRFAVGMDAGYEVPEVRLIAEPHRLRFIYRRDRLYPT